MGVGKTIQAIASMSAFHSNWPLLVICPSGVKRNWKHELLKWLGKDPGCKKDEHELLLYDYNIEILTRGKDNVDVRSTGRKKVFIVSFTMASKLVQCEKITEGMFKAVIIDESHELRTANSQRTKACSKIAKAAEQFVMLSGSPVLNSPSQLMTQISLLANNIEKEALAKYTGSNSQGSDSDSVLQTSEFVALLAMFMIRRLKDDVLELPPKVRKKVTCEIECDEVKKASKHFLKSSGGSLAGIQENQIVAERNDDEAFDDDEGRNDSDDEACDSRRAELFNLLLETGKAKVDFIAKALKIWIKDGKGKICVFAYHRVVLDRLEAAGE